MTLNRSILPLLPLGVAALTAAVAGCRQDGSAASTRRAPATQPGADNFGTPTWDAQPLGVQQQPVAVAEGPSPLVHLFDHGGPIRVVDLTSNMQLAAATVGDRTLVRVDDRNGVNVGAENVLKGPLTPGHRYAIFADPQTENVYRRTTGPPAPRPDNR